MTTRLLVRVVVVVVVVLVVVVVVAAVVVIAILPLLTYHHSYRCTHKAHGGHKQALLLPLSLYTIRYCMG